MTDNIQRVLMVNELNNMQGGTKRVYVVNASEMGDSHNLGYYATQAALEEAHATAEAGDYAIVGATDTVWIWDTDTSAWVDSGSSGSVTSVNGQTGDVTIGINDILPDQTSKSGYVLGTDGFVAGWVRPEIVQRSALPQASEEEVDKIYQYVGTTDATYTNGYFYKCVSDGQDPATYSWTRIDVQPTPSELPNQSGNSGKFLTTDGTNPSWATVGGLPSQTGQSGKFLTTDGTDASWSDKPLVNTATGTGSLGILNNGTTQTRSVCIGDSSYCGSNFSVSVGYDCGGQGVAIGNSAKSFSTYPGYGVSIGMGTSTNNGIAIGHNCSCANSIILSCQTYNGSYSANTGCFNIGNANGNFEMMSADGTIPAARHATLPAADGTYVLKLVIASGVPTLSWVAE